MARDTNERRALSSLFSVDAWTVKADEDGRTSLCVDVTFSVAKMGGDGKAPVSFVLRLRRAEIVVIMPVMGEYVVDPQTVARLLPGKKKVERSYKMSREGAVEAGLSIGAKGVSGKMGAEGKVSASESVEVSSERLIRDILSKHGKTHDGHYAWELVPSKSDSVLEGPAWDATEEPRFGMVDKRSAKRKADDARNQIPPVIKVQVRCRREDLDIDDIRVADEEKQIWLSQRKQQDKRLAAAESYIRNALIEVGLMPPDLSGDYVELVLADCLVSRP